MKKATLLLLALAGSGIVSQAQNASAWFDVNEVRSEIFPKNSLFWDGAAFPNYEVPAGSGKHSMFVGNVALLGKDANNLIRGFYNRYHFSDADTLPGPLTVSTAGTTQAIADSYKRVWKINQWEINVLRYSQVNGDLASGAYVAPTDIAEWPANAPAVGYADGLAPFNDSNGDGIYNIMDGDYPIIKGEQMLYFILNDKSTAYGSGGNPPLPLGVEIHVSVYGCKKEGATDSTGLVNYVTFLEYEIVNRSSVILDDVYIGFNTDADVGYAFDDYMGTHVDANAIYFVNGDAIDAQGSTPAPDQYGEDFPVQSIQFLEAPGSVNGQRLGTSMHYVNSSGVTGGPTSSYEFYNYLGGYWKDGSKMVFGGSGYPGATGATNLPAQYMFPGDSDPALLGTGGADPGFIWTQKDPCPSCPQQSASDQRALAASYPFSLAPSGSVRLVLGLITTFLPDTSADAKVALNRQQNKLLKQWYDNGNLPCVMSQAPLSTEDVVAAPSVQLYPNPATDVVRIAGTEIQQGMAYELLDIHGRKLRSGISQQQGNMTLSVDDLANGIYFLRLQGTGQTHTVKFIKQ